MRRGRRPGRGMLAGPAQSRQTESDPTNHGAADARISDPIEAIDASKIFGVPWMRKRCRDMQGHRLASDRVRVLLDLDKELVRQIDHIAVDRDEYRKQTIE